MPSPHLRPRHVGLNVQLLAADGGSYRSAGIHRYIEGVLTALPRAGEGLRYTAFAARGTEGLPAGIRTLTTAWPTHRPPVRIVWEQSVLPWWLMRHGIELLHSLAFVSPVLLPCPSVVTVYDLSFDIMPERFPSAKRRYLSTFTRLSCRRARRIVAISESTRADLARLYGLPLERIDVAYPGVDPAFRRLPQTEVDDFRRRRGLPERFILHVGTLEPRKNLPTLIRAFAALNPAGVHLVLAGGEGWMVDQVTGLIDALGLGDRVHRPGYIPSDELARWYNAAEVLAYPSAYEGFGMPPAEAMACGTPVVVSNASSLPEVVGGAGLIVPPGDVDALAPSLGQVLGDAGLRDELRERGPRQAARFTWERTAEVTASAYRRALGVEAVRRPEVAP